MRSIGSNRRREEREEMGNPTIKELVEAVDAIIHRVGTDRLLLREWASIPNISDCQPEVMRMMAQHGEKLDPIIDLVSESQEELGVNIDTLNVVILTRLRTGGAEA